jgi:hypothetical protein
MDPVSLRQLLLAILSMDSYNRGYGRGLKFSTSEDSSDRNEISRFQGNAKFEFVDAREVDGEVGFAR